MSIDPAQLLKRLEPPVRPGAASGLTAPPHLPIEQQSFDQLLTLVARGDVRSDQPVELAFSPGREISSEQMERLAAAADLAQTRGARRAVMLIDGRGLVMDVAGRKIESELDAGTGRVIEGIDAAVYVAGDEEALDGSLRLPGAGVIPPAVAAQIEAARDSQQLSGGKNHIGTDAADRSVA
jgi:hypothetical protein